MLSDEGRVLAMDRALVPLIGRGLRRDQSGDADQIVGDQVEQEIGSNGGDAAVLGLAHCTVLFAPAEDAFGRSLGAAWCVRRWRCGDACRLR